MTQLKRVLAATAAFAATMSGLGPAIAAPDTEDGLGPCQDAPFARLDRHPGLEEHRVDGVRVLVLRPRGFDPQRRYPVLYLLHGSISVPDEWVTRMELERLTEGRDVIVVMPDGGRAGMYRDWANGARRWESFHTQRLVEWVDETFPTVADRSHRAIAGLSMGGGGAMFYAARHPDVFGAVGSFSGLPMAYINAAEHTAGASVVLDLQQRCEEDQSGVELYGVYGNPITDEVGVQDHMPTEIAHGLKGMPVYISAGDGVPADDEQRALAAERPESIGVELLIGEHADALSRRLDELGVPHIYDKLPGSHWWATFRPALARFVDMVFAEGYGRPAPVVFDYRTARERFTVWDWEVTITGRDEKAFTTMEDSSAAGFTIAGRGTATVGTARLYRPRERLVVTIGGVSRRVRSTRSGRMVVTLALHDRPTVVKVVRTAESNDPSTSRGRR